MNNFKKIRTSTASISFLCDPQVLMELFLLQGSPAGTSALTQNQTHRDEDMGRGPPTAPTCWLSLLTDIPSRLLQGEQFSCTDSKLPWRKGLETSTPSPPTAEETQLLPRWLPLDGMDGKAAALPPPGVPPQEARGQPPPQGASEPKERDHMAALR